MVVSRVGSVRPMETATLRSVVVRKHVRLSCSDSEESDDDVLSVGAVRPLATVAPLGGPGLIDDCQLHVDSNDDVLSVGTWAPMNRPAMCCARLDDFDWVVPDYDPDILLSGRDIGVGVTDLTQDIQVLPDVFPAMFDETAAVPLSSPVVIDTGPQVDIRRETTPAAVPLVDEMILLVATVGMSNDGSDRPAELLNLESGGFLWMRVCLFRRCPRSFLRGVLLCRRPCRPYLKCFPLLF